MSRHFSIPTVLRMVPNKLLKRFFEHFPFPLYSLDLDRMQQRQAVAASQVIRLWPDDARMFLEDLLRNIFDLACDSGLLVIREAAQFEGKQNFVNRLMQSGNLYAKSMLTWLEEPDLFEHALLLHQIENQTRWRKRDDVPATEPRIDDFSLECLARELSHLLVQEQGRGHHCTVEHYRRENGIDYFCCYLDDFLKTVTFHDEMGELTTRSIRQTFEIIFAYNREEGELELAAKLPTKLREQFEEAFSWSILDEEVGKRTPRQIYNLNRMKDARFELLTDPADEIHVELRQLRLDLGESEKIVLMTNKSTQGGMQSMIETCLDNDRVNLNQVNISQASLYFRFRSTPERKRGSNTIKVSSPNICNLRNLPPDRAAIVQKHLKLWRISHG